jgi:hypothetical protein
MPSPAPQNAQRNAAGPPRETSQLVALDVAPLSPSAGPLPEMLFLDVRSSAPLPDLEQIAAAGMAVAADIARQPTAASGTFWLDGDALLCACPDCGAPMSVRLWLMIADCWRCGISIELSQQQEAEALRLLQQREEAMRQQASSNAVDKARPQPTARPSSPEARPARAPAANMQSTMADTMPSTAPPIPSPGPSPQREKTSPHPQARPSTTPRDRWAPIPERARRRSQVLAPPTQTTELTVVGTTGVWLRAAFRDMPAWFISLIVHLVLLTLLGLITFGEEEDNFIVLSSSISSRVRSEGDNPADKLAKEVVFDLPIPDQVNAEDPQTREVLVRADQDARELRIDADAVDPQLPNLEEVKSQIGKGGSTRTPLAARDPRVRVEMVKQEGGTTLTEAAVARGLRWIALNQHHDGHWSLSNLPHSSGGQGQIQSDTAATSLALLPYLGAGQTHLVGMYKDNVSRGLRWLISQQKEDGDLRGNSQGNAGMYAHGQSAIVLCEAYGMTHDEALRGPAQRALDFIVAAQHSGGGWRYRPGEAGDTSVVGWQLMALQSGRAAGLVVPAATFENASHFLDTVASKDQSRYAYLPHNGPTNVMTAEALLCRIYLGWKKDEPGLAGGINWLLEEYLPSRNDPDIYYWYYATQTMHHYGGPEWNRWNLHMRDVLVASQEKSGKNAGSWSPVGRHASEGGRLYMTALSVCTLEVYYRHLPVFRQLDID